MESLKSEINWDHQWELFCPYFKEGKALIPLEDFGGTGSFSLIPGGGFGDLSHPTTQLMLQLTCQHAKDKIAIDLGCGSGILSLAALKSGAKKIYGLDIEIDALEHTKKNAELNHLSSKIKTGFTLPANTFADLLLLNMTFFEQKNALSTLSICPDLWITSGILEEQKTRYLEFILKWPIELLSTYEKDGWLAFIFTKKGA